MGKAHIVPKTDEEAEDFFAVNLQGTKHLCAALEALPSLPSHLVFISSVAVYGLEMGTGIHEDFPLLGQTAYARSKIAAEAWLQEWCTHHRVRLTILRLPLVAGPHAPGNLGAMEAAISRGRYVNIAGGHARKSMVLARDIARHILPIAEAGGIYNLTDGHHPSFAQLAAAIAIKKGRPMPKSIPYWVAATIAKLSDITGFPLPLNKERLEKITATLIFDDNKARQAFGWNPNEVIKDI
jgi:nucleoside-diphosphate-sugar epimerase